MTAIFITAIICLTLVILVYITNSRKPKDNELPMYRDDPCPLCKHWLSRPADPDKFECRWCKWSHRSCFEPKELNKENNNGRE